MTIRVQVIQYFKRFVLTIAIAKTSKNKTRQNIRNVQYCYCYYYYSDNECVLSGGYFFQLNPVYNSKNIESVTV